MKLHACALPAAEPPRLNPLQKRGTRETLYDLTVDGLVGLNPLQKRGTRETFPEALMGGVFSLNPLQKRGTRETLSRVSLKPFKQVLIPFKNGARVKLLTAKPSLQWSSS